MFVDVLRSSEVITERLQSLMSPTPGAAEALGPGFGTRLFQQLLEALTHPFEDGQLSAANLSKAIHAIQDALELIFPDTFGAEMNASVQEFWTALQAFAESLNASLPVQDRKSVV